MKKVFLTLALLLSACNPPKHYELPDLGDNQIYFHGGPVLDSGVNVYFIWYGNWTNSTAVPILTDLIQGLDGSSYFNTNTTYYGYTGMFVINNVNFKGSFNDSYSRGSVLNDADIYNIVTNALNQGKLPVDENGVYFVLTSSDVDQTEGFCTQNCGWHSYTSYQGKIIKLAFVGDAGYQCQANNGVLMNGSKRGQKVDGDEVLKGTSVGNSCIYQLGFSPNNNPAADGMASVVVHELSETTTDPDLDGWYDGTTSGECADKCAWIFGNTYYLSNSSQANVHLGSRDYLIQQNWVNASGGYCALKY